MFLSTYLVSFGDPTTIGHVFLLKALKDMGNSKTTKKKSY